MPKIARVGSQNLTVMVCIDDFSPPKLLEEAVQFNSPLLIPNIRALMLESTHFQSMQATVPICKASRASMFAGASPMKTRVWNNEDDDAELYDYTQSWVAQFKQRGQVDGIGKLSHEVDPQQSVIDACYTRMHIISKNAVKTVTITSQSGISGTAGQVFDQVRLIPKVTADGDAASAYCKITLNGAGNAIATVEIVEKRDLEDTALAPVPRFEMGASGSDAAVGDTYEIEGLGYDPVTLIYSMPLADCVVTVATVTSFWKYADEGAYEYGTFTDAATVVKGDNLITAYAELAFARLESELDLSRRLIMLGLKGPHTPLIPNQAYLDMHPLVDITIPTGYDVPSSYMLRYLVEDEASSLYDDGKLEEYAQYYLAVVEEVDARIGEIVASLKAHGLWARTNFAIWSDHSFAIGNQNSAALMSGIYKKFKNFGTATCCFAMMRDPGYSTEVNITESVSAMDIGPTLLEMAGIPVPAAMEGQSLLGAIRRPTVWTNSRSAISFCFGNISIVKTVTTPDGLKPMRLIKMFNGEILIYRDDTDPLNKTSLTNTASYAAAKAELLAAMETELVRLGKVSTTGTADGNLFLQYAGGATLTGGAGDDTYIMGSSSNVITESGGGGTDTMIVQYSNVADATIPVPANIEYVFIDPTMDAATITVAGATGVHVVGGIASATGNTGDDSFVVSGSGGPGAVMYGGGGADNLDGTPNQSDTLYGGAGADTVRGASGSDTIDGGAGDNRLGGGGDNDSIIGGSDNDSIYGGSGADSLYGSGGLDLLQGDGGADLIYAGAGNDSVYGGQGNDTLYGEGGDDLFKTGRGTTVIYGGSGANILQVGKLTGTTTWMDYASGAGNKTRFLPSLGLGVLGVSAATLLSNVQTAGTDVGADFVLTIPDTGATITYIGKLEASFVEADFEVAVFDEVDTPDEEASTSGG